jgi:predicted ester cyclase
MKKYQFFLTAVFFFLLISSYGQKPGVMTDKAKNNLQSMHGIINCFDTKDFSKLGKYIDVNAIDHAGETGDINGLTNMKAAYEKMVTTFESSKTKVIKELVDDEFVMSWLQFSGTMKTDQMGMKAGDKFETTSLEVAKFKNGKVVEHWVFMQPAEIMKMMNVPEPTVKESN